jgi:linoleoyl-CoA desaturase
LVRAIATRISLDGIDCRTRVDDRGGAREIFGMRSTPLAFSREPDPFFMELTLRVRAYLSAPGRSRYAGPRMWLKTATIVGLIAFGAVAIYSGRLAGFAFVMTFAAWQFAQFLTTIGIAHDATHGAYSRSQTVNRRIGRIFDVLGIDSKHWIDTHVHSHHGSPNVPLLDSAIESFSIVRLHPRTRGGPINRYQHLYMFLIYALATVFQVYLLEPVSFAQNVVGFARKSGWRSDLAQMLLKKTFVLGYSLILPLVVLRNPWPEVVGGWLLGHAFCGLAIGIIFQTTHLHQSTSFIEADAEGRLPNTFAMHILRTTSEFSVENPLVTWVAGGLNLHVTHHLFPSVSQIHLPALSRIVRNTAREFGVPYVAYSFFGALRSHVRALKRLGALPSSSGG